MEAIATNSLGDLAVVKTVTTPGGAFYNVRIYTDNGPEYRLQIAHSDADRNSRAELTEEQILANHLVSSLGRYGFTKGDFKA